MDGILSATLWHALECMSAITEFYSGIASTPQCLLNLPIAGISSYTSAVGSKVRQVSPRRVILWKVLDCGEQWLRRLKRQEDLGQACGMAQLKQNGCNLFSITRTPVSAVVSIHKELHSMRALIVPASNRALNFNQALTHMHEHRNA